MKHSLCMVLAASLALLFVCCAAPQTSQMAGEEAAVEDEAVEEADVLKISVQEGAATISLEEDEALPYRWSCSWIEGTALVEEHTEEASSFLPGAGSAPARHVFAFTCAGEARCVAAFVLQRIEGGSEILDRRACELTWTNGAVSAREADAGEYEAYWSAQSVQNTASQVLIQQRDDVIDLRFENWNGFHWEIDAAQAEILTLVQEFQRDAGYATYRMRVQGAGEAVLHAVRVEDEAGARTENLTVRLTIGADGALDESEIVREGV